MSWIHKLYETYEQCADAPQFSSKPPLPVCHTNQQAHIEISIDNEGNFRRARVITDKDDQQTLVPCTEASGGRSGIKPVNHPLCDKLQYVAGDFLRFGGEVTSGFARRPEEPHEAYWEMLKSWCESPQGGHPKLTAILKYVEKRSIIADLLNEQILYSDTPFEAKNPLGKLLKTWKDNKRDTPPIFKAMPGQQSPENAFIRWKVECPGDPQTLTGQDQNLIDSWIAYYDSMRTSRGLCMVTGEEVILAEQHPAKIRHGADKAKIISSNDNSVYTFRGRFADSDQACGVGLEVTQKAHNALRWLIARQGFRNGDQVFVAWAVSGENVPDPWRNSSELFGLDADETEKTTRIQSDAGEAFAHRLNAFIAGYQKKLGSTNDIVIIGLDSATPGRMALTYYRELTGSDFLARVQAWHEAFAWHQEYSKRIKFVGAPSPDEIAKAVHGSLKGKTSKKLHKATVERLLSCIIDGQVLPRDLIESIMHRTCNRSGLKAGEFEKFLGIACALFRGYYFKERGYKMVLETDRTTRDYLYGCLLAIAENIENFALKNTNTGEKNRDTTASKLMQRFSDRPYSTWKNIELALNPYKSRLRSSEKFAGFLHKRDKLLDEVVCALGNNFTDDTALTGEFLLGYHCQRKKLFEKADAGREDVQKENSEGDHSNPTR